MQASLPLGSVLRSGLGQASLGTLPTGAISKQGSFLRHLSGKHGERYRFPKRDASGTSISSVFPNMTSPKTAQLTGPDTPLLAVEMGVGCFLRDFEKIGERLHFLS